MTYDEPTLKKFHAASMRNRVAVKNSKVCGCFYCGSIYPSLSVREWVDDGHTALCPMCRIDAVLAKTDEVAADDRDLLDAMHRHWFDSKTRVQVSSDS